MALTPSPLSIIMMFWKFPLSKVKLYQQWPSFVVAVVDMQSKAYAKAQGVPTTWSQEDQGYIARWYSYYCAEAYFKSKRIGQYIRKVLIAIFILLNLFILHTTVTCCMKPYQIKGSECQYMIYCTANDILHCQRLQQSAFYCHATNYLLHGPSCTYAKYWLRFSGSSRGFHSEEDWSQQAITWKGRQCNIKVFIFAVGCTQKCTNYEICWSVHCVIVNMNTNECYKVTPCMCYTVHSFLWW